MVVCMGVCLGPETNLVGRNSFLGFRYTAVRRPRGCFRAARALTACRNTVSDATEGTPDKICVFGRVEQLARLAAPQRRTRATADVAASRCRRVFVRPLVTLAAWDTENHGTGTDRSRRHVPFSSERER